MAGIMAYLVKKPDGHTELKLALTKDMRGQSVATLPVATIPTKPSQVIPSLITSGTAASTSGIAPRTASSISGTASGIAPSTSGTTPGTAPSTSGTAPSTAPSTSGTAPGTTPSTSERMSGLSSGSAPKVTPSATGPLPPKRQQVILPVTRIKTIMKTNVKSSQSSLNVGQDSVMVIAKATELFIAKLAQESHRVAEEASTREVVYKHLSTAVRRESQQMRFLFDILPEKMLVKDYLESLHQGSPDDKD